MVRRLAGKWGLWKVGRKETCLVVLRGYLKAELTDRCLVVRRVKQWAACSGNQLVALWETGWAEWKGGWKDACSAAGSVVQMAAA
jgi:hypothetical protein